MPEKEALVAGGQLPERELQLLPKAQTYLVHVGAIVRRIEVLWERTTEMLAPGLEAKGVNNFAPQNPSQVRMERTASRLVPCQRGPHRDHGHRLRVFHTRRPAIARGEADVRIEEARPEGLGRIAGELRWCGNPTGQAPASLRDMCRPGCPGSRKTTAESATGRLACLALWHDPRAVRPKSLGNLDRS